MKRKITIHPFTYLILAMCSCLLFDFHCDSDLAQYSKLSMGYQLARIGGVIILLGSYLCMDCGAQV